MKILQINKFYYPWLGGIESVVKNISEKLNRKKGLKVEVLCCNSKCTRVIENINKVKIYKAASFGIILGMPLSIDFFYLFKKMANQYDIIHIHWPFPLAFIAVSLLKIKPKIIITWHSEIVRQKLFNIILKPFVIKALHSADVIIAPTKNHIIYSEYLQKFKDKIRIVPFGISQNHYKEFNYKQALKIKKSFKDKKIILFVGRLAYYKGLNYLLMALEIVKQKLPNFILLVIGEGNLKNKLIQLTKSLALEKYVLFIPPQNEEILKSYFLACDVFVLPSIYKSEAFGLVQLEAMLAKKPVINTNLESGVPLVSLNNKTGSTVPPKNHEKLASELLKLLCNKKIAKFYGNNAHQRVIKYFSLNTMIDRHLKLYNSILK